MYKNYGLKLKRHYSSLFIYVFAITIVVVVMSLGGVASVLFSRNDGQNDKVELVYEVNYERIDENTGKVKWDFKDENEYVEFLTFKDLSDDDILYEYSYLGEDPLLNYYEIDSNKYQHSLNLHVTFLNVDEVIDLYSSDFWNKF